MYPRVPTRQRNHVVPARKLESLSTKKIDPPGADPLDPRFVSRIWPKNVVIEHGALGECLGCGAKLKVLVIGRKHEPWTIGTGVIKRMGKRWIEDTDKGVAS